METPEKLKLMDEIERLRTEIYHAQRAGNNWKAEELDQELEILQRKIKTL